MEAHIENAGKIADWLAQNGPTRLAKQARSISLALSQHRREIADNIALRRKLTPIAQARASEARAALNAELVATANLVERMAKIADTGGSGPVGIEVPDAAYLSSLLRRAVL